MTRYSLLYPVDDCCLTWQVLVHFDLTGGRARSWQSPGESPEVAIDSVEIQGLSVLVDGHTMGVLIPPELDWAAKLAWLAAELKTDERFQDKARAMGEADELGTDRALARDTEGVL
jgi:hypothetical protein